MNFEWNVVTFSSFLGHCRPRKCPAYFWSHIRGAALHVPRPACYQRLDAGSANCDSPSPVLSANAGRAVGFRKFWHCCCSCELANKLVFLAHFYLLMSVLSLQNNINLANLLRATNNNNNTDMGNNNINAQIINLQIPGLTGATPNGPMNIPLLDLVGQQNRPTGASGPTSGTGTTPTTNANGPGAGSTPPTNQQQGQSARNVNNLPDDVVTRVYIPLYHPSSIPRMRNIIQTMGAPPPRG